MAGRFTREQSPEIRPEDSRFVLGPGPFYQQGVAACSVSPWVQRSFFLSCPARHESSLISIILIALTPKNCANAWSYDHYDMPSTCCPFEQKNVSPSKY